MRLVVDYRKLNDITIKNSFGLPRADEQIESIRGAKWFTKLDLYSGYNQLRVATSDQHKTAFKCKFGHYEYTVTPFGLTNAPASFQALMNSVLHPLIGTSVLCYLDDILIYSPTLEQHIKDVTKVFNLLKQNELYVKLKKCELFKHEVSFLGHKLSADGISVEEDKVKAIREWPLPKCVRDIQSFLGAASCYRRFINKFSDIAAPLFELLKKDVEWKWGKEQQSTFDKLKSVLSNAPVLMTPDYSKPFTITSDASQCGIGGVLTQLDEKDLERPIAYYSKKLNDRQMNWSTYEQECYALVESLKHFRHYVEGQQVTLYTDCKGLIYLNNQPKLTAKQARWIGYINLFNYTIKYREGRTNNVADGLSRQFSKAEPNALRTNVVRLKIDTTPELSSSHLTMVESSLLQELRAAQSVDEQCSRILSGKRNDLDQRTKFFIRNGIVVVNGRYFIPPHNVLRNKLLSQYHDKAGHVGVQKTFELLSRTFYWRNMYQDVQDYVRQCISCQRNKPTNQSIIFFENQHFIFLCFSIFLSLSIPNF